jgi:hypothetical protein
MSTRATRGSARRGSALVSVLVLGIALFGLVYATTLVSVVEVRSSRRSIDEIRTQELAQSGIQRGFLLLSDAANNNPFDPIGGISNLFAGGAEITPLVGEHLLSGSAEVGAFTVRLTLGATTSDSATVTIQATGYLPDAPGSLAPGEQLQGWHSLSVTVNYTTEPSEVFNYAYFINNWGWFYGSSIFAYGNAGGNGQFDVGGYAPTVSGQPIYDEVLWNGTAATLLRYHDDNKDGLQDGNDGGVFSGWDIANAAGLKGNGGLAKNQHEFEDPVPMPNLSNLAQYEAKAIEEGGTLKVGATTVSDAVYGDGAGESQNLYLLGTLANPIQLDGQVVVKGDVIISGYVTGQGAIYAGGNVYVPNSIQYVNAPTTVKPAGTTQAQTEAWLTTNWNKDFLGLFAAENVVVGDHTSSTWQSYVSGWMTSGMNKSEEDAGEDGIPNSHAGKDGVAGTADDDVLEDDNTFTVEYYTDADAALGLIPAGKSVGDVIPGSGEDIDGDGQYDTTTSLADVAFGSPLTPAYWGGNMPMAGIPAYSSIASLYAARLDATFYTNHSFCYVVFGGADAVINGAVVSRNENIVYGTPKLKFNYDCRLLGGKSGIAGELLPQVLGDPTILRWDVLDRDPLHHVEP